MTTLIIGGTGFIGRRLIPLLARRGEEAVCMDINPQTANYSELAKVRVLRGDISQFDDLMGVMTAVKPDRVINLAYYIAATCHRASRSSSTSWGWTIASRRHGSRAATGSSMPVRWRSAVS